MRRNPARGDDREHGAHTLRVQKGTIVGCYGNDVFVEIGPRVQGVIDRREFDQTPEIGAVYEFTLRGKEEELWSLALAEARSLSTWEDMECGSWVQARVVRRDHGGLQVKVGPMHAFMPKSQSGLARDKDAALLIGKTITCEVIEVDRERQRAIVSRRAVLQKERDARARQIDTLQPGQVVQARITRIENYSAFVRFKGGEGLIHISNLSDERVAHPDEVVKLGESVEAKILTIRQSGKRIALGLKQMHESPWKDVARTHYVDEIIEAVVTRIEEFGAFVALRPGVEGLLPRSQTGGQPPRAFLKLEQRLSLRILDLDCESESITFSLLHKNGARIDALEAQSVRDFTEFAQEAKSSDLSTNLGDLLRRAMHARPDDAQRGNRSA